MHTHDDTHTATRKAMLSSTALVSAPFLTRAEQPRKIYVLKARATGKHYVGLTTLSLKKRISGHISQSRRGGPVRHGGLMQALRRMDAAGKKFAEAFDAWVVAEAATVAEARSLERHWIAELGCRIPTGLNALPGGGSVGGPSNAKVLTIELDQGRPQTFETIGLAIANRNRELEAAGEPKIEPSTVYFRLSKSWSEPEALGYRPHDDGRGQRPLFTFKGVGYRTLRAASADTGLAISTLRSRLHRARQRNGEAEVLDIGYDCRSSRSGSKRLLIPWRGTDEKLTAAAFASRTGVSKSNVIARWHRMQQHQAHDSTPPSPTAIHEWLTTDVETKDTLALRLPDRRLWFGGYRELARRVLSDTKLEAARPARLKAAGMKGRLYRMTDQERDDPDMVAWAFGLIRNKGRET